jgi:hypothetical protein
MSRFTVAEQLEPPPICSAPRLRIKSDVAHVKADFFPLSLPLILVPECGDRCERTLIKTSNINKYITAFHYNFTP